MGIPLNVPCLIGREEVPLDVSIGKTLDFFLHEAVNGIGGMESWSMRAASLYGPEVLLRGTF